MPLVAAFVRFKVHSHRMCRLRGVTWWRPVAPQSTVLRVHLHRRPTRVLRGVAFVMMPYRR